MELAIPLLAMGGLYIASKQSKETFENKSSLPNVDVPDANFSAPVYAETDVTSKLSVANRYDGAVAYTDKYFNPNMNQQLTNPPSAVDNKYRSLNGEMVGKDHFKHGNMVPFFGGNIRSRHVENASESILDNYTGAGSQIISKQERAPLFAPDENSQWANGAPNNTDFMRSRVNPSMRMANVKPFEEERVAPGLGLGYTTGGAGGFNSGMMNREAWSEKTVDDLRVASKPKSGGIGMLGYEGPASSRIKNIAQQGIQEKNRPDRHFEMNPDRYMTTTGLEKGPTMRSITVEKHVSRPETAVSYSGGAGVSASAFYIDGEHMPSHHQDLGALPLTAANAVGRATATESDYGIKAQMAYPNNRTVIANDDYFGAIGGAFGAAVAPLLDALRPTRKETTVSTMRPYQNARAPVASSYVYDPTDKPLPTIRELNDATKNLPIVSNVQRSGAYYVTGHQETPTSRAMTGEYEYSGIAGGNTHEMRSYAAEYNQRNNDVKASTIDSRTAGGNIKIYSANVNMAAKPKDAYLENNRAPSQMRASGPPSANQMGRMTGAQPLHQTIQLDRNTSDMMSALSGNPYAIPYAAK
jgi:hypothetical protein